VEQTKKKWKSFGWEGSLALVGALAIGAFGLVGSCESDKTGQHPGGITGVTGAGGSFAGAEELVVATAQSLVNGRNTFRFDTFGDEAFWGDALKLHQAIAGAANGGVGDGVSPEMALAVGLKVDAEAVPADVAAGIKAGTVDLKSPATTLALLKLNAVVGVTGFFASDGGLRSMGIQCALCHSTVDNSFLPGIGKRLDGWPNRDLNVGAIISLAPDLSPFEQALQVDRATVLKVVGAWGPGRFDAELMMDGQGFRPDGKTAATLLPAAFGLAGVALHTYTGWGSVTHWNAFVANLEMMGKGTFFDPRLNNPTKFPVATRNQFYHVVKSPDLISGKLGDLHLYQLALKAPPPPAGSFDGDAARRGKAVFNGSARCASCHVPPMFSEPGWPMHTAAEIGIDDFQAKRSPDERYRTTPLGGLHTRVKGGFYHDGRFATLEDVVNHYETVLSLTLSSGDKADLVQYLKSL
jgi:hypothetical protein